MSRWVCTRAHYDYSMDRGPRHLVVEGFVAFVIHQLLHWYAFGRWAMDVGFWDNHHEMGVLFWRWDFWNARLAGELREIERRAWERRRQKAIDRWGEGAG